MISLNERSYSELTKSGATKREKGKESYVLNLYIDMLLSEVLLKAEIEKLTIQIDKAIDERDEKTFNQLSRQFSELKKRFGT